MDSQECGALDMDQVQAELATALRHIEDLPRQFPHEAPESSSKPC